MKRVSQLLIVLSLLLSACAVQPISSGGANAGASQEKDVILFYTLVERMEGHPYNQMVEEYNATHDDVHVEFLITSYTGGWWEWLGTLLAAGNPPDAAIGLRSLSGQGR
jgi:ABC-type glycerol-3-phosphate transport system substrate-binding protein